jgi:hypothetical protein
MFVVYATVSGVNTARGTGVNFLAARGPAL